MLSLPHVLLGLMLLQIYAAADKLDPSLGQPSHGRHRRNLSCEGVCEICYSTNTQISRSTCESECATGEGNTYAECFQIVRETYYYY